MFRRSNPILRTVVLLCAVAFLLAAGTTFAASRAELKDWNTAAKVFNDRDWSVAEKWFSEFMTNYPQSENFGQAIVQRAQARYFLAEAGEPNPATGQRWRFEDVTDFLNGYLDRAGTLADLFLLWRAKAEAANSNFTAAAGSYSRISQSFPQSSLVAEALVGEADACKHFGDIPRLLSLLGNQDGLFQQQVRNNPTNDWVIRGLFLLIETQLQQANFAGALSALAEFPSTKLSPEFEWKRRYLACGVPFRAEHFEEVMSNAPGLLSASAENPRWIADSRNLLASACRRLGLVPEAISNYDAILSANAPIKQQRQALLDIVDLLWLDQQSLEATERLTDWIAAHPDDSGSDFNLLTLGEMLLRQYYESRTNSLAGPNSLLRAQTNFLSLAQLYTNSPAEIRGKAQLNLGWCYWAQSNYVDAAAAFSNAILLLPEGEAQAVALFKLGDSLLALTNRPAAISNYSALIGRYGSYSLVSNNLFEPALYQIVNASAGDSENSVASNAVARILAWFPDGVLAEPSVLLLGQAANRQGKPAEARNVLSEFAARWPSSPLKPDVDLLIARTFEREGQWSNVIDQYQRWIAENSNNPALPSARYSLAYSYWLAGNRTTAFQCFTNFVNDFPSNELTGWSLYWIGTYFKSRGDYGDAENAFQKVFSDTRSADRELQFRARMEAGKSAWSRQEYGEQGAVSYFASVVTNKAFKTEWRLEGQFALADATIYTAPATNLAIIRTAADQLSHIVSDYPGSAIAAPAWARLGDCYLQLAVLDPTNYLAASNAYSAAASSTNAPLRIRCLGNWGIAQCLKGLASSRSPGDLQRKILLDQAKEFCLKIVYGKILLPGEPPDLARVKDAGFEAGQIMQDLGEWDQALNLYNYLKEQFNLPDIRAILQARVDNARKHLSSDKL